MRTLNMQTILAYGLAHGGKKLIEKFIDACGFEGVTAQQVLALRAPKSAQDGPHNGPAQLCWHHACGMQFDAEGYLAHKTGCSCCMHVARRMYVAWYIYVRAGTHDRCRTASSMLRGQAHV